MKRSPLTRVACPLRLAQAWKRPSLSLPYPPNLPSASLALCSALQLQVAPCLRCAASVCHLKVQQGEFPSGASTQKGCNFQIRVAGSESPSFNVQIPWARGQKCSVQIKGTMRARTVSFFAAMNQSTHVTPRPGKRRLQQLLRRTSEAVHQGTHASCQRSCGRSVKCGCHQAHNGLLPPSRSAPSLHCCVCV